MSERYRAQTSLLNHPPFDKYLLISKSLDSIDVLLFSSLNFNAPEGSFLCLMVMTCKFAGLSLRGFPLAGWPGCYTNVRCCGGPSMVLLQLKDHLELFVKRREFFPGSGFLVCLKDNVKLLYCSLFYLKNVI